MNIKLPSAPELCLKGFSFKELFLPEGLASLDSAFLAYLQQSSPPLAENLLAYRMNTKLFAAKDVSLLLIECARELEYFIADLFNVHEAVNDAQLQVLANDPIFLFKQWYVLREAKRRLNKATELPSFNELTNWLNESLAKYNYTPSTDMELAVSQLGELFLSNKELYAQEIDQLISWCVKALSDNNGKDYTKKWVSFRLPHRVDFDNLVALQPLPEDIHHRFESNPEQLRNRDGFKLTDKRMSQRQVLEEIHYCVYCHKNEGDFCSKGFPVKKGDPSLGFKTNPLNEVLTGCPLEEKISEMHVLKRDGYTIGALAMIMVDNPMCPATGHRICNDCMKSCIYQKQEPVNIPQTETGILTDVLKLPWGVEIYDLLTRWNPLRQTQWVAKPYNGLKVLIMGMGPAGFTLAHHLTMEGFAIVGADGLKIEPLPKEYIEAPIYSYQQIVEELDSRILTGFGGVAEYGITVRWDKNFLKLIYLTLSRRPTFQVFGGVRFGGTLTVEDAWALGFDHMAIAVGAGLPKELNIPGSLAPGMRQANDFLMALQLTGAAKKSSLANLQIRLPAIVIGGGLTGIDTATEVQAYYITQVEKIFQRYQILIEHYSQEYIDNYFSGYSKQVLAEYLAHGQLVKQEREQAALEGREVNFIPLLRGWGGVTVVYRKKMQASPAYTRNHEEVTKAFEEGILYAENLEPVAARLDEFGHVISLVCSKHGENEILPARSIFVATGAKPNIAYEFEHRGTFHREGSEYQTYTEINGELEVIYPDGHCKVDHLGVFTSYQLDGYRISFLGDTHPVFHGSVVKAVASAKRTYPNIVNSLGDRTSAVGSSGEYQHFAAKMRYLFDAVLLDIKRLTPNVVELTVKAPIATQNFKPGQFYRLQNFETHAAIVGNTRLLSEGVALIGSKVNKNEGTLSFIVAEQGTSTRLFATLKPGCRLAVMGPTGVRSRIAEQETVMIVGNHMASAYLLAMAPALKAAGNRILFVGIYQNNEEVINQIELEQIADSIIWITQDAEPVPIQRETDYAKTGEVISVLLAYNNNLPANAITLSAINKIHIVGNHRLIKLIQSAKKDILHDILNPEVQLTASIYGPMQCMLKGVCAQCLQWQIDPLTGKRTKAVFACSWQDQTVAMVDLDNLQERLSQNHMQETLTNLWLNYLFDYYQIDRI